MGRKNKVRKTISYAETHNKLNLPTTHEPAKAPPKIKKVTGRTPGQKELIKTIHDKDITFVSGVAGTGKTLVSVGIGLELLLKDKIEKIIVSRPMVTAGEEMGFLPGNIEEKSHPFLIPIYDSFLKFITQEQLDEFKRKSIIEIAPIGFLRGRTLESALIIIDEAQNATLDQLKMIITRIGERSKLVINGDPTQSDLPHHARGGFHLLCDLLADEEEIGLIYLTEEDIQRHKLIAKILPKIGHLSDKDLKNVNFGQKTALEFKRPSKTIEDFYRGWMDRDDDGEDDAFI